MDNLNVAMWVLFGLAQLADIITTNDALDRGGVETNPIIRTFMRVMGRAWWAGKLAIAGAGAWLFVWLGYPSMIWAITALTALVAWSNTRAAR